MSALSNSVVTWAMQNVRFIGRSMAYIFSKLGRLASEEVILQLIGQKCLPVLLYGLEVCSLSKRHMQSLDFAVNRVLMKLFKSSNIDIIDVCRDMFNFRLPSELLAYRSEKFLFNVATDVCLR